MMTKKSKAILSAVFIAAEFSIWILIISGKGTNPLRFLSVVLAFLLSLTALRAKNIKTAVPVALFCTVLADFCLVILSPMRQIPAMIFFSLAQISYATMLFSLEKEKRTRNYQIYTRIALTAMIEGAMLAVLKGGADLLSVITMFYFANLCLNAVFAAISARSIILSLGFIAFIACDVFVGLGVLFTQYINADATTFATVLNKIFTELDIVWFFYIPSQTFISLYSTQNKA